MGKYNFDDIVDRRDTDSIKYMDKNILPMWVADMDFRVLPEIVDAIKNKAEQGCFGYVDILDGYFESYQEWYHLRHNINIPEEYFVFSLGVVATIDSIFKHLLNKGDKVMMFTPIYHTFFSCIEHNELELIDYPLSYDDNTHQYRLDLEHLEEALNDVNLLLFCNPHNPTGHIYSKEEVNEVARICHEKGIYLVSDEIHFDITKPGTECNSMLCVDKEYLEKVIVLAAPTKAFNLASIQSSVAIIPNPELKEKVQSYVYMDDVGEPNFFSCAATIAAYKFGADWNDELRVYLDKNKTYLASFLKTNLPNIYLVEGDATYLCWLDISSVSTKSDEFAKGLKEEVGLWVAPGTQFRGNGNKFLRINLATSLENVKDACRRLEKYIKK